MQRSILIPDGFSHDYRYPLVIWLCRDERERRLRVRQFPRISNRNYIGLFVDYPDEMLFDSTRAFWTHSLLELLQTLPVHRRRIYLAGVGDHGYAAYQIMAQSHYLVSGAISLLCHLPVGFLTRILSEDNSDAVAQRKLDAMRLFWMPPYMGPAPKPLSCINHDKRSPFWLTRARTLTQESRVWSEVNQFVMQGIYSASF
jgi:hypothetical protein